MKKNSFKVVKICPSRPVVLITGAGSPGVVGIIRQLKQWFRVIAVDADSNAIGFKLADDFYTVPEAKDKEFIPALLKICIENDVKVVFPKVTVELDKLSESIKLFKDNGTAILVSPKSSIKIANDKYKFLLACKKAGVDVPEFFSTERFCSKPRIGSGSDWFKLYPEENQLVMEYLPGDEYSVDILCDNGEVITSSARVREKIKAGVSVEGTSIRDYDIEEDCRKIVKALKLHGIVGLQFKRDKNGKAKPIECNPRIQGTIMLSEMSGANLFLNGFNLSMKLPLAPVNLISVRMNRFWSERYE